MNGILLGLADVFSYLLWAAYILVLVAVVLNWIQANPYNSVVRFVRAMTEPIFWYLKRRLPWLVVSGFDLSPIAVILIIMFLEKALVFNLRAWGMP